MQYLVMPWGRVGSNLILDILAQSPEVRAGRIKVSGEPLTRIRTKARNNMHTFARQLVWLLRHDAIISVSAHSLVSPNVLATVMRGPAVYLDRRDIVRTAVSVIRARAYAKAHAELHGSETWAVRPGRMIQVLPRVEAGTLLRYIEVIEAARRKMDILRKRLPGPTIWYEDILADLDGVLSTVWSTFGLAPHGYAMPSIKATPEDLRAAVSNPDELASELPRRYASAFE